MESKTLGLLTVSQAADYLNIPRPTLYQHLREGRIPGIQIGGRWRIETKVLQRFLGLDIEDDHLDQFAATGRLRVAGMATAEDTLREIDKLQQENRHLRSIIAQQLLELHELEADKATTVFRPSSRDPE